MLFSSFPFSVLISLIILPHSPFLSHFFQHIGFANAIEIVGTCSVINLLTVLHHHRSPGCLVPACIGVIGHHEVFISVTNPIFRARKIAKDSCFLFKVEVINIIFIISQQLHHIQSEMMIIIIMVISCCVSFYSFN